MAKITWNQQDIDLFGGFYNSELYHDDMLYSISENAGHEYDFIENGWAQYQIEVSKKCVDNIMELMEDNDAITDITFKALNSPQYYNYTTDKLECEVECDMDKIRDYCYNTHKEDFDSYLKLHYTSCSGFISFIENDVEKFKQKEDTDVMIDFYIINHLSSGFGETGPEKLSRYNADSACDTLFAYIEPVDGVYDD